MDVSHPGQWPTALHPALLLLSFCSLVCDLLLGLQALKEVIRMSDLQLDIQQSFILNIWTNYIVHH